jgi:hypothetical protein
MRAIKVINIHYDNINKIDSSINKFLNDQTTGEIYSILVEKGVAVGSEYILYSFFYELLAGDETEHKNIKQRKIDNNIISKSKPKLL